MGKSASSSLLKSVAGLCAGLGLAGTLFGAPTCPTTGTDIVCTTVTGTLTLVSGPDPLMLAGGTFTAVSTLNAVGAPFVQGTGTYMNVPLSLAVSSSPLGLSCMATIQVVTAPSKDQFNVTSCTLLPGTIPSTLTTNVNFAGNTIPDPIPLPINASITAGSTATYVCGLGPPLCSSSAPTVLGISAGSIASTCVGCSTVTLTPPSLPTFNAQVGGPPQTSSAITVGTVGGAQPYALTTTTATGGNWLTTSAPGGESGGTFTVTATPGSLTAGTYNGTVKVWTTATNSPLSLPVTLTITNPSFMLVANPTSFTFNSVTGVPTPTQSLTVTTSPSMSVAYTAAASTTDGHPWLIVSPTSGMTGGSPLTVSVDPTKVPTGGTYTGKITLTSSGASNSPLAVMVTFNDTVVTPNPTSLTFSSPMGGPAPPAQTLNVNSTAGLANVSFAASTTTMTGGSWLQVTPTSGTSNVTALMVSVIPGSLAVGTYHGNVVITPTGATTPVMVPVTYTVSALPMLSVLPAMLSFSAEVGGSNPPSQSLTVSSTGGTVSFSDSASTTPPGGTWLSVTPGSGSTSSPATLTVSINIAGLTAATYNGMITVTASGASNSPVTIPVTLVVGTNLLSAVPPSLSFSYQIGGATPPSQTTMLSSTTPGTSFTAAPGAMWLGVMPTSGTTPATLTVSVNIAGLTAGTYNSMVTVTAAGSSNSPFQIPVMLTVTQGSMLTAMPSSLSFSYNVGGTTPMAQSVAVSLGMSAVSYTAVVATNSGGPWLSVMPGSGTTPSSVSLSVNPAGLAAGNYSGTLTLTSPATASPTVVPVSLAVSALTVDRNTLTFNFNTGGSAPPSQSVSVSITNGPNASFTAAAATMTGGPWLSVMPSGGTTPLSLSVSANPAGLAVGTYNGTVTIAASGFSSQVVSVSFVIAAPKANILVSGNRSFGLANTAPPVTSILSISVSDMSAKAFTVTGATPPAKWLTFSPTSGTTPGSVTLTVNPAGLTPGTYESALTVSVPGTTDVTKTVPVNLTVTGSNLSVSPAMLTFTYQPGQVIPPAQTLSLSPITGGPIPLSGVTANVTWLKVSQVTSAPATVQVTLSPGLLAPGSYAGEVYFTGTGSPTPSLAVAVALTVNPLPLLTATPASLAFSYAIGGTAPAPQSLEVSTAGVALNFAVNGPSWLVFTPPAGSTGSSGASVLVTPNTVGLGPGTYNGAVSVAGYGVSNGPILIPATLTVTGPPPVTTTPATLSFAVPVGGPAPAAQTVDVATGSASVSFTATSSATWLVVTLATGTTPAMLTVSINPAGLVDSTLTGTVTITPALGSPTSLTVTLKVGTGISIPMVTAVANAASGATGTVSPGLIVSIFGSGLGPQMGVAASAPPAGGTIATTLGGTQVLFDGTAAPLLYSGDGQVNAIVPFEVGASTVMTVTFGGNTSTGTTLPVAASTPGFFTADGSGHGEGAIINQDGTVNSASSPAPAGSFVSLFGTGGGQTVTPMTDGEIAASEPNNLVLSATAMVGGQPAEVQYAGWAPTLVAGVDQVNVMIPSGTPSGPATVVVTIGTAQSQTVTVMVQ